MSGLEMMKEMVGATEPPFSMAATIPMRVVEVEAGRVVIESEPGEQFLQPGGLVHGGYAMTLIDSAAGGAANTLRPDGALLSTLETKVNLVRAIRPDTGTVRATGTIVNAGRRVIVTEARVVDAEDHLLALGSSTLLLTLP